MSSSGNSSLTGNEGLFVLGGTQQQHTVMVTQQQPTQQQAPFVLQGPTTTTVLPAPPVFQAQGPPPPPMYNFVAGNSNEQPMLPQQQQQPQQVVVIQQQPNLGPNQMNAIPNQMLGHPFSAPQQQEHQQQQQPPQIIIVREVGQALPPPPAVQQIVIQQQPPNVSQYAGAPILQQQPQNSNNNANSTPPAASYRPVVAAPAITRKLEYDQTNLFVSGLHYSIESDFLTKLFSEHGEVVSCKVLKQNDTGRSKGVGFVHFANKDAAATAVAKLDGSTILVPSQSVTPASCVLKVKVAEDAATYAPEESSKLFIRNLPTQVTTRELHEAFMGFGVVLHATVLPDKSSQGRREGSALNMGYVTFERIGDATAAANATHHSSTLFANQSKPLEVKHAESLAIRNQRRRKNIESHAATLPVSQDQQFRVAPPPPPHAFAPIATGFQVQR